MDPKLQGIINHISTSVKPTKIYLFGSRARGDHRANSDYDIVIIYDGKKSRRDVKLDVYRSVKRWDFSMDMFVLSSMELDRYKHVATTLEREITENGVVVYG